MILFGYYNATKIENNSFANLVQGSMIVDQYDAIFMDFERFSLDIISIEGLCTEWFQDGLQPCI